MEALFDQFFDLDPIRTYFPEIMAGFNETVQLSVIAGVLSLIWGLILSLMRQLPGWFFAPVRALTIAYIDIFRGIPLLVLLLILYSSLGTLAGDGVLPDFIGRPEWLGKTSNFWIAIYGLTLTYGAYMAEVFRAGLESVPRGQMEAARSLGMSHGQAMRHVVVPQAISRVTPPLLNDFIALMKDTALASVIGLNELVQTASDAQSRTYKSSSLILAALLFLLITIPLARILDKMIASQQARVERGLP